MLSTNYSQFSKSKKKIVFQFCMIYIWSFFLVISTIVVSSKITTTVLRYLDPSPPSDKRVSETTTDLDLVKKSVVCLESRYFQNFAKYT